MAAPKKAFLGLSLDGEAFSLSFRRLLAIGAGLLMAALTVTAANLLPGELYFGGVTFTDCLKLIGLIAAMLAIWWAMQGDQRRYRAGSNVEVTTSTAYDLIITGGCALILALWLGSSTESASWHFYVTGAAAAFVFWVVCHRIWKGV